MLRLQIPYFIDLKAIFFDANAKLKNSFQFYLIKNKADKKAFTSVILSAIEKPNHLILIYFDYTLCEGFNFISFLNGHSFEL